MDRFLGPIFSYKSTRDFFPQIFHKLGRVSLKIRQRLLKIGTFPKGILTTCKWPRHLVVLNFVNSGITIIKMANAKALITLIG